jgi:hypothetical protein
MPPSVPELSDRREEVREGKHSGNEILKQYIDARENLEHLPRVLRPGFKAARDFYRAQKIRVKKLTRKIRRAKRDDGPKKAVAYLRSKIGTVESPPGSNDGGLIRKWWSWLGYTFPVPWCGCLAGFAAIKKGGAAIAAKLRLGFTPYIVEDARANRNGLRAVSAADAQLGDLAVFDFNGGGADHVGVCTGPVVNGLITTIDGNTSGPGGSQADGGGVFERTRPVSQVICFARPDYD